MAKWLPWLLLFAGPAVADPPAVPPPRLVRGDEFHYVGEVTEGGDRTHRFRKFHDLEVRLFVLETRPDAADCALLTRVHPRLDDIVTKPVTAALGTDPVRPPAAVRVDLVRVDHRGRVTLLRPPPGPPPVPVGADVPAVALPAPPVDRLPVVEAGLFVPLPAKPAAVGSGWASADPGRPPVVWAAAGEAFWNGGRCVEVRGVQQTDGYDQLAVAASGWKRTDRLVVSPADGLARVVERRTERRHGKDVVGWVAVKYELRPPARHTGARYADVRRDAELAYCAAAELTGMVGRRAAWAEYTAKLGHLDRACRDHPPTGFRDAVDAARRRYKTAAAGDLPPAPLLADEPSAGPPRVGGPAPDFVAPLVGGPGQVRLSAGRGKPSVVIFYRPGASTAAGTLAVADALHARYGGRAAVLALALHEPPATADRERERLNLAVPVADGSAVRAAYAVETFPRFFVVDAAGTLAWQFDGFGPEVGFLAREQVERALEAVTP